MPIRTVKIEFPNSRGESLAASLELPEGEPEVFALFAHCFTCSKDIAAASRISRGLRGRGIAVLRFDFTGLGNSDGDFANTNFSSNIADLVAAADFLRTNHRAPQLLVGHSLGGAAVLAASERIPEVRAIATIGAPSTPQDVEHLFTDRVEEIERQGFANVELAGRTFRIEKQFLDDLGEQDLSERLGKLRVALMIFHSPIDEIVAIDHARRLYTSARHPKSFVSLDQADHLLSKKEDSEYVAAVLAAWAGRYLEGSGSAEDESPSALPDLPEGTVEVAPLAGKFTHSVRAGHHRLTADEPTQYGGDDRGPNPYDLLLASLGSCTAMTMRMYADRKGWPFEGARVRLKHEKIHAKDCEECEAETGKVDRIEKEIEILGPLDEAQRTRLMEIADRCPVHRTLLGEKEIVSREVSSR
jgi:uncharacterized OsmC-like protein/pimeloyl-ACP methyl ester carboxylesterase